MKRFLQHLLSGADAHLTDDQLASHICGEMFFAQRWAARRHLRTCWQCRLRKEDLEGRRASSVLERYRAGRPQQPLSEKTRADFSNKLRTQIDTFSPQKKRPLRLPPISIPELSPMNPAFVACLVFGVATMVSVYFWWQQRTPAISSNALLVRAERWDTSSFSTTPGVVYQAVRITVSHASKKATISRSMYRDTQGKRKPKQVRLDETAEQVRSTFTDAGLDWNEPLSASSYQNWHDHQHIREDRIDRAGRHLLRLTTTVPDGVVAEQSLTVRDTDFHPIQRTIELRDSGTVEIAEVDFKILPWSSVDANVFEPIRGGTTFITDSPSRVVPFPRLPQMLSEAQLDEAELGARLMLNQLHADTAEQLTLRRTPQGITVEGVVDTDERKRELVTRLRVVPHVSTSIQSAAEAIGNPSPSDGAQTVAMASMPDQLSALQAYLKAQGKSVSEINDLGQRLFQNAVAISQESRDIADLQTRFGAADRKTVIAMATLNELIYSHHERLEAALQRERELLRQVRGSAGTNPASAEVPAAPLVEAANRNLSLAKELTQTNHPAARTADMILSEISSAIDDVSISARDAYGRSQTTTLSGKK